MLIRPWLPLALATLPSRISGIRSNNDKDIAQFIRITYGDNAFGSLREAGIRLHLREVAGADQAHESTE